MGQCKNCKYWEQNYDSINFYNENFGECTHSKFIREDEISHDYNDKRKERYNNYHVIYSSDEVPEIKMNKEFGCINFEEK